MSQTSYDALVYDQLNPEERLFSGYKAPRVKRVWAEPFPDHLIGRSPEEIDQQEKDRRNDEFLKSKGV